MSPQRTGNNIFDYHESCKMVLGEIDGIRIFIYEI